MGNQYKRAKPTHTDPKRYDMKVDSMMQIGTTSKTWNPKADDQFWQRQSGSEGYQSKLVTFFGAVETKIEDQREIWSSVAGDTSEGSAALPRLGSIDELEGEAVRDWRVRHSRH